MVQDRQYLRCPDCSLIYMHPRYLPAPSVERDRYLHHRNELGDEQYSEYIRTVIAPLMTRIPKGAKGLDYGCGAVCVVESEFEREGFRINSFDPFFRDRPEHLDEQYSFIFCCETAEHFHNPLNEFVRFQRMLKTGGWIQIVTRLYSDSQPFDDWWYARDFTHTCFYSETTMHWIGNRFEWGLDLLDENMAIYRMNISANK